jgi:hypothetical protein
MMTNACGKVIAARNEKNKALKISSSLNNKYRTKIPTNEAIQYTNAALKYLIKF